MKKTFLVKLLILSLNIISALLFLLLLPFFTVSWFFSMGQTLPYIIFSLLLIIISVIVYIVQLFSKRYLLSLFLSLPPLLNGIVLYSWVYKDTLYINLYPILVVMLPLVAIVSFFLFWKFYRAKRD